MNSYKRCVAGGGGRRRKSSATSMRTSISRKISSCTSPYTSNFGLRGLFLILLVYSGRWTNFSKSAASGSDMASHSSGDELTFLGQDGHFDLRQDSRMFSFRNDHGTASIYPQGFIRYAVEKLYNVSHFLRMDRIFANTCTTKYIHAKST